MQAVTKARLDPLLPPVLCSRFLPCVKVSLHAISIKNTSLYRCIAGEDSDPTKPQAYIIAALLAEYDFQIFLWLTKRIDAWVNFRWRILISVLCEGIR